MPILCDCRITGRKFTISDREADLLYRVAEANKWIGPEPLLPTVAPYEGLRRIAVYGNLLHLYWAKSAISGKPTLSRFNPDHSLPVVTPEEFWSDQVDNRQFGRPYDFNRPFFEQFNQLLRSAYSLPLGNVNVQNCDYINGAADVKDSYLSFSIVGSSDCLYCFTVNRCTDLIDCCFCDSSRYCYSSVDLANCYQCQHCRACENCQDCIACVDCRSCSDCTGCIALENQRHCWFNQPMTESEYRAHLDAAALGGLQARSALLKTAEDFHLKSGHRPKRIINCEDSTGAYLRNCSGLEFCFNSRDCRDCVWAVIATSSRDCGRGYFVRAELCTTGVMIDSYNCHFSYHPFNGEAIWHSFGMYNGCKECFGCVGLKKAEYCILNRQYSRNDYYELLPRIAAQMKSTAEWGEWFPVDSAPYSYDEGWANQYFERLSDEEISRRGYNRRTVSPPDSQRTERPSVERSALPDNITDFDLEQLGKKALRCSRTSQPFSLQKREIDFYIRHHIPLPALHWRERILDIIQTRVLIPDHDDCTNLIF